MEENKAEQNISLPIKRKTLDKIIMTTSVIAAIDFVLVPSILWVITGEYTPLHEYLGLPPKMGEIGARIGAGYWGVTMLYSIFLKDKFLGNDSTSSPTESKYQTDF